MVAALSQYIVDGQLGGTASGVHINGCLSMVCAWLPEHTVRLSTPDAIRIRQISSHIVAAVERMTDTVTCNKLLSTYMMSQEQLRVHLSHADCIFVLCAKLTLLLPLAQQHSCQVQELRTSITKDPGLPELCGLRLTEQGFISACHQGDMPPDSQKPNYSIDSKREELAASAAAIWHWALSHLQELESSTSPTQAKLTFKSR